MQPVFVCPDYPGHDVEFSCYGTFVAVEDNLGGLIFELVDEHACGLHVGSPLGCGVAFASYVVVTGMTNLMCEHAPALDWCEPVADEYAVVCRVVSALKICRQRQLLHVGPFTGDGLHVDHGISSYASCSRSISPCFAARSR